MVDSSPQGAGGPLRWRVAAEDAGRALLDVVAAALGGDAALATSVLTRGGVWRGKMRVQDGTQPVDTGEELTVSRPPSGRYEALTLDPAWIIYEDADLLALNKPPGAYVDVTPWATGGNLRAALELFLAQRDGSAPPLHLAHRLDRDTSGVLLFSKNPSVNAALQATFAGGEAHKTYLCLCAGAPPTDAFEVTTGHGRGAKGRFRVYPLEEVGRQLPGGGGFVKRMQTRFTVVRRMPDAALVRAFPVTGRTHQIRLHMAYLGHPLLGDTRYGGPPDWRGEPLPQHLLHATKLALPHPRTGAELSLSAPSPAWAED